MSPVPPPNLFSDILTADMFPMEDQVPPETDLIMPEEYRMLL